MPRRARQASGTGIYHVMMRGINHQNIFEEQEDYYQFFRMGTLKMEIRNGKMEIWRDKSTPFKLHLKRGGWFEA